MSHRHGGNILIRCYKNVKTFSDRFNHTSLKIKENKRLSKLRFIALSDGPEMKIETLNQLGVAC